MNKENEIVLFETKDRSVKLPVALENEMVWLTANQMAQLFDRDEKTIRKHINNVFSEGEIDKDNNTQKMRVDGVKQPVSFYKDRRKPSYALDEMKVFLYNCSMLQNIEQTRKEVASCQIKRQTERR